jgi:hypothetical protein
VTLKGPNFRPFVQVEQADTANSSFNPLIHALHARSRAGERKSPGLVNRHARDHPMTSHDGSPLLSRLYVPVPDRAIQSACEHALAIRQKNTIVYAIRALDFKLADLSAALDFPDSCRLVRAARDN